MDIFDRVSKVVGPKKMKLAKAEEELNHLMSSLVEKRSQLQVVTDKLQGLNDEFTSMTRSVPSVFSVATFCLVRNERKMFASQQEEKRPGGKHKVVFGKVGTCREADKRPWRRK